MKKLLIITGILVTVCTTLIACGEASDSVEAGIASDFVKVSQSNIFNEKIFATVLKHKGTGCYYTVSVNKYDWGASSIEPMFVEKNGVSVPYCEE